MSGMTTHRVYIYSAESSEPHSFSKKQPKCYTVVIPALNPVQHKLRRESSSFIARTGFLDSRLPSFAQGFDGQVAGMSRGGRGMTNMSAMGYFSKVHVGQAKRPLKNNLFKSNYL